MQLNLFENKNLKKSHDQCDKIKHKIPDYIKNCAINDCKTVEEFARKYRKAERFTGRGEDYAKAILKTHYEEIKKFGYTIISRHDSITGENVAFVDLKNYER